MVIKSRKVMMYVWWVMRSNIIPFEMMLPNQLAVGTPTLLDKCIALVIRKVVLILVDNTHLHTVTKALWGITGYVLYLASTDYKTIFTSKLRNLKNM